MKNTKLITQEEIDKLKYQLSIIREPENLPTEEEVIEIITRMKERWGIA